MRCLGLKAELVNPTGDQASPLRCMLLTGIAAKTGKALKDESLCIIKESWAYPYC